VKARRALTAALLAPLGAAGLVVVAVPALAAGIVSPGNGVTYTTDTNIAIRADINTTTRTELRLKDPAPGSAEQVVDSGAGTLTNNAATLSYNLDTGCATYPSPSCSGRAPARNGTWTVRLSGGASGTSTFVVRIPPAAPTSLTAKADGTRAVVVSWRKGDEPDLVGWTLYGDGGVVQSMIGLDSCSGTACSATVTNASDGTGQHTYALTAHRSVAPGSSETLESDRSGSAGATLEAPAPSPQASPAGGGSTDSGGTPSDGTSSGPSGGTSTGGSSGSGSGGSSSAGGTGGSTASGTNGSHATGLTTSTKPTAAIAQRRAFALTFKAFAPKLGIPKLPPLPATTQPAVAPLPDGTYKPTLGYKPITRTEKVSAPKAAATKLTGAVGSAFDSEQFVRSLAGALILLLLAAHLRRWLGTPHDL
jgi:hypothetical protein